MRPMVEFSLATGLRESNVRLLEWSNIDLERAIAWVHGDQAKAGKSLAVPLNSSAMDVLNEQFGKHWQWVFPLKEKAISGCNNKGWRGALKRAGIESFRLHDLRHTWASSHVRNGASRHDLKNLGGWAGMQMVERYARMTHKRLAKVAGNINGTWQTCAKLRSGDEIPMLWNNSSLLAPRPGLEPGTCGLIVYRSVSTYQSLSSFSAPQNPLKCSNLPQYDDFLRSKT